MPTSRRARDLEVDRRCRRPPASLRNDPAYAASSRNWDTRFNREHDLRRQAYYTWAPTPPASSRWDLPPHMWRWDAPPLPRSVKMEVYADDELALALEASKHTLVDDERKR